MAALDTCTYLGIYPDNIEKASDVLEAVCKDFNIDSDKLWMQIDNDFSERYGSNFGNAVNALIFDHLAFAVEDKGGTDIDYEVNGACIEFFVNDESY